MRSNSVHSRRAGLWAQRGKSVAAAIVLGSSLLLSACNGAAPSQPTPEPTKEAQQTTEPTSEHSAASTPETDKSKTVEKVEKTIEDKSEEGKTPQGFNLPKGAYLKAGGPVPEGATELKVLRNKDNNVVAVMKTPTGNIGCDIGSYDGVDISGCGIYDIQNPPLVEWDGQGKQKANWADLSAPEGAVPRLRTDVAFYMMGGDPAEIVPYGKVVYYQDYVCASEKLGLTCWNTKTGHGTFMNHKTMKFF